MGICITKDMLSKIKEEYEKNKLINKGTTERNGNNIIESTNNNDYTKKLKSLFLKCDNSINFNENDNDKINYILFRKHKSCELLHSNYSINLNKIEDKKEILNSVINVNRKNFNNLSEDDSSSTYSDYIDISKHPLLIKNENTNKKEIIKDLNYDKKAKKIRNSYYYKLIIKNVWKIEKEKAMNNLFFFDWDDTLLPTTFLTPNGVFNENIVLSEQVQKKISKLESSVNKLLKIAVQKGDVYIITNAGVGWVEFSAEKFYPTVTGILKKIKIISARGEFEKEFPGDSRKWKIQTFLTLKKKLNVKLVTNIICLGDSLFEMEAGRVLASQFKQAFIKTVKFREGPKPDELNKQLNLVISQFNSIYSAVKNLTIRVEKKKQKD